METLCQSLDSVESALLSVTGDGLSVDGHCNKSDCRELDCDLILSVTGVSQIPVDLECILIPCGEKHAFYMKMEAFGVILMEGTYSETTSIATSIFDSPGNIDVIIVPDLSSVQLTVSCRTCITVHINCYTGEILNNQSHKYILIESL